MGKSANRTTYDVEAPRHALQIVSAVLIGGGAGDLTMSTQDASNGEVLSAVRTGTGRYTVSFRYNFPKLYAVQAPAFVGPTNGLIGKWASFDIANGTAALEINVGVTPTDLPATDAVHLTWFPRNTGSRP